MNKKFSVWTLLILCLCVMSVSKCSCSRSEGTPQTVIDMGEPVLVTTQSIGASGGNITVADAASPLNGLTIAFPAGAVASSTEIKVSYADINESGSTLPSETHVVSKMLILESSSETNFNKPVTVTFPYDTTLTTYNEFVNAYEYLSEGKPKALYTRGPETRIEVAAITARNTATAKVSFMVRHFSNYLILEWAKKVADVMSTSADFNVDTGFSPSNDGWFIANYGSILNPGGNCIGMSSFAKWFFTWKGVLSDSDGLYNKYRQGDPDKWEDDVCAIEIASRMQTGEIAIWKTSSAEMSKLGFSSLEVAKSFVQAMRDTGQPQIMYVQQAYADGTFGGAHAILARAYSNGVFKIYDPNFPGNEDRKVTYTYNGNWGIYNSGTSASDTRFNYNQFGIIGSSLFHGFDDAENIYNNANMEPCFGDKSLFPTITVTAPTDTNGDGKLDVASTNEVGTTLEGTITGGSATPTHTIIYVNGTKYDVALPAGGAFSQKVPLYCAETASTDETMNLENKDNVVEFLVTDTDAYSNYAGYAKYIVSCTGPTPLATVTLTWDTPLDIDLHVTAPDATEIFYSNPDPGVTYPYLDFDDTTGTGPEHIFFDSVDPITTGNYAVSVKYYSAHGADPAPAVGYTITIEKGFMLDGVPMYDEPEYYTGTLTTVGETQAVHTFLYPDSTALKTLLEGQQGI